MNANNMNPNSYANSPELLYGAHYAILQGTVSFDNPKGKFKLDYVNPNGESKIKGENTIELTVPKFFFYIMPHGDYQPDGIKTAKITTPDAVGGIMTCEPKQLVYRKQYTSGTKFIVINMGGNIDTPRIIGVEE